MQTGAVTRNEWVLGTPQRAESPRGVQRRSSTVPSHQRVVLATSLAVTAAGFAALAAFVWSAVQAYTPLF